MVRRDTVFERSDLDEIMIRTAGADTSNSVPTLGAQPGARNRGCETGAVKPGPKTKKAARGRLSECLAEQ
uniref:hypothetical protein n=1 Tax=Salinarimonas chemoclinalis TaxID=3241599 RepID=UPI0035587609